MSTRRSSRPSLPLAAPLLAAAAVAVGGCATKTGADATSESTTTTADTQTSGSSDSESGTSTGGDALCESATPQGLAACVDRERYLSDLEFIAQPRAPGSAHWQAVQNLCAERLTAYGYEVDLHSYATGVNVLGRKLGTQTPDEQIIIAAHYDSVPDCGGADDNATGVAATLEAARVLAQAELGRTLIVACWDEEEDGLIGSEAYAALASTNGDNVVFNYNFEMIGFRSTDPNSQTIPDGFELLFPDQVAELEANEYRADFLAIVVDDAGLPFVASIETYAESLGVSALILPVPANLKNSDLLADLRRSDHAAFWELDIPAVMLTDTSNFRYANYHCGAGEDAVELLDHDFARAVTAATVLAAAEALGVPG